MWIFTTCGFFSVIEKPEDSAAGLLTVRARVASDLAALRAEYMPELGPTGIAGGAEYPFQARIGRTEFARGMQRITEHLDYPSLKDAVFAKQGANRARVYGKVWRDLLELEDEAGAKPTASDGPRMAWLLARTIQKFYLMHGHWPSRIELPKGYYDLLLLDIGQLWHKPMLDKLSFSIHENDIRALDDAGSVTTYRGDACADTDHREALLWIFG